MRHTHRHTKPLPTYLTSSTFQSAVAEGGRSISHRKRKNKHMRQTKKQTSSSYVGTLDGPPYSVTFVDRGFSRYLTVFFSRRDLDFSFPSFLHSVTISVQLWASRAACFQFCWILKAFHACHPLFLLPAPSFLDPITYCPEHNTLGEPSIVHASQGPRPQQPPRQSA